MTLRALSEVAADYLDSQGLLTKGTDLFVAHQPDSVTQAVVTTLFDYVGDPPGHYYDLDQPATQYDKMQVRVVGKRYSRCYELSQQIIRTLETRGGFTEDNVDYSAIYAITNPFSLGKDNKDRFIVVTNFRTVREERQ